MFFLCVSLVLRLQGGASAITVESLLSLARVKSVADRTTTLLHCLVEALAKAQPDLLVSAYSIASSSQVKHAIGLLATDQ